MQLRPALVVQLRPAAPRCSASARAPRLSHAPVYRPVYTHGWGGGAALEGPRVDRRARTIHAALVRRESPPHALLPRPPCGPLMAVHSTRTLPLATGNHILHSDLSDRLNILTPSLLAFLLTLPAPHCLAYLPGQGFLGP